MAEEPDRTELSGSDGSPSGGPHGTRAVVVVAPATVTGPGTVSGGPPGTDPAGWTRALLEDTCEVAAALVGVVVALAGDAPALLAHRDLVWPGTRMITADPAAPLGAVVSALPGAEAVVLLPPDAPDLPGLFVGKLFRDLERSDVTYCPASGGGLAGLGVRLPVADWVLRLDPGPDTEAADLTGAAPTRASCRAVPGWHRIRQPGDLVLLDPGLEGWEATRALLSGRSPG